MKTVKVVAAVICDGDKIFATARGYEVGESPQQALRREIKEELDTNIEVGNLIGTIEYDYPTFHLSMDCFWCKVINGRLVLKEAEDARWLTKDTLYSVSWLPADIIIIEKIGQQLALKVY